ncbi:hypothetical protein [Pontibacter cellulosilyticus]|uniref:Outer membrane protein beta-barrel domain-containing protein n=1 Tax=Pontibacter cellulosilyticus TaxID=1720253 RepID=A0A923SJT2_9BACT|nr:hypothetical protein [Pontibacter cellulosilyticus]MBC5994224.1 hypothetical protein [Pontibacter cellulosilyticus]
MKLISIILKMILCFCFYYQAAAQQPDNKSIDSLNTPPAYKFALGLKYSFTNQYEFGITAKYFVFPKGALEAGYSGAVYRGARLLSVMYERHANLYAKRQLLVYYGGGAAALIIPKETYRNLLGRDYNTSAQLGIGITVGVEKSLGRLPLAISLDTKSIYFRNDESTTVGKTSLTNATLGLKYKFN